MKVHKSLLRIHRKRSGLSQKELANLLGYKNAAVISRLERGQCPPRLWQFLALEIVFGVRLAELFPPLFVNVEDDVMRRAYKLHLGLNTKTQSKKAQAKLTMLNDIKERATQRIELRK
jgi:transcriptional regulator with XRE-family HTH domain